MALLVIAGPSTLIVQVTIAVIIGRVSDLPALMGLSLGILLISVGVVSVSSARLVVPVARAGRNPFSAQAGAATTSIFASYLVALATLVLAVPVSIIAVPALVLGSAVLGWLALAAGLDDRQPRLPWRGWSGAAAFWMPRGRRCSPALRLIRV